MDLQGKGYFMWQLRNCDGGDPEKIAAEAVHANLTHVLIKIADGANWIYNYDYDRKFDYIPSVRDALKSKGIAVWGWQYVRGGDPIGEARMAVNRMRELDLDGFVVDAEIEYKEKGRNVAARRYMEAVRSGLGDMPIALSTFRFPKLHYELPFEEFLTYCDFSMPQVYHEQATNVEEQLEKSVEQYLNLKPARPVFPTSPTYSHAGWKPTPDEVVRFLDKAVEMGLPGVNSWGWDFARRDGFWSLWDAFAAYDWPTDADAADMPDRLLGRLNQLDPAFIIGLYNDNAAHVTGARTVVGRDEIKKWYKSMFTTLLPDAKFKITGKSGQGESRRFTWTAKSNKGKVLDGSDTLGLKDGRIQYHYTYFTVS
ncbi:MAG: nuclear transport factor 2 family protein [Anaerolineales bacterium]|nr:nuclear transport factor 2 family protein [Anaerolineales bacterium]